MKTLVLTVVIATALCGIMPAATASLNSSLGTWSNCVSGAAVFSPCVGTDALHTAFGLNGGGTNFIQWGRTTLDNGDPDPANPGNQQSGYKFIGNAPPAFDVNADQVFLLGTFTHNNFPILPGSSIRGVTLDIDLHLGIPSGPADTIVQHFLYDFVHDETRNNADPCPYAPTSPADPLNAAGCQDKVHIVNNQPATFFDIGGQHYTLLVLGFSQDGGTTFSNDFLTQENAANNAQLYAKVTVFQEGVPEPSTMVLCGVGLLALARGLRKVAVR